MNNICKTALILTLFLAFLPQDTNSAVFNPATTQDLIDDITTANSNGEDDIINLMGDNDYTITGSETGVPFLADGNNGLPSILPDGGSSLTINGNGATIERDSALFTDNPCNSASDNDRFRIFHISEDATLNLNELTLQNGCAHDFAAADSVRDDDGGAILSNGGTLNISNCIIQNSESIDAGGGVLIRESDSVTNITDTTVTGNTAGGSGGGIAHFDGTLLLQKSTIHNNSVPDTSGGGGIRADGNSTIINTTISNNSTMGSGGGLQSAGLTDIINCTFVDNVCSTVDPFVGCGIRNISNPLTIKNTIVVNNGDGDSVLDNCFGQRTMTFDAGNNLSNDGNDMESNEFCFDPVSTNSITDFNAATFLDSLANYGGPTMTHALLQPDAMNNPNPAVNGVMTGECADLSDPSNPVTTDQRSVARPQDSNCDIGAYELGDLDEDGDDDCFDEPNDPPFDSDGDGLLDMCEADGDNDGVDNIMDDDPDDPNVCRDTDSDNCDDCTNTGADMSGGDPANDGLDTDGDGLCDEGDTDDDNDGVDDSVDTDPQDQQVCSDTDMDMCDDCTNTTDSVNQGGNPADDGTDADGDGICTTADLCDDDPNKTEPGQCGCGVADTDTDSDMIADCVDNCVNDPNMDQADNDNDDVGDVCDDDDDNDGVLDEEDSDPLNQQVCSDTDGDSCDDCTNTTDEENQGGNTSDDGVDTDADGICDAGDNCPINANANQSDSDGDGEGDVCDPDDDSDIVIGDEETDEDGLRVLIQVGEDISGPGRILVDLPSEVIASCANIGAFGSCSIVEPNDTSNVAFADADVICDVNNFPSGGAIELELCLCGEEDEATVDAEIEVMADIAPGAQFDELVQIFLEELDGCSDGGGCSIASTNVNNSTAMGNFLVTLIPAIVGFAGIFFRRRKSK